jgi:pyruvate/2-oxoacid:ferredoxin oxidoreductase alpha subunit
MESLSKVLPEIDAKCFRNAEVNKIKEELSYFLTKIYEASKDYTDVTVRLPSGNKAFKEVLDELERRGFQVSVMEIEDMYNNLDTRYIITALGDK